MNLNDVRNTSLRNWFCPYHQRKNAPKNLTCPIYFCAAGANLGISSSKPTNHQTLTPHHSLQVSGMVSQMAHVTLVHLGRWANISEISLMFWDTGRNESQAILTKKMKTCQLILQEKKKYTWPPFHLGNLHPFRWQGAAAMMVMNMVYWMKAAPRPLAGFLRFADPKTLRSWEILNPWISQILLEEITANTAENQHVYLELFRKKMTCRAGFWSVLEANPSGIKKKKREAPKKQGRRKENQTNPIHSSTWSANGLLTIWANPSQCPFTFSNVSCCKNHLTSTSSKSWNNI